MTTDVPHDAPPLEPVIPGCTANKYYTVPAGMKPLRRKRKVALVFGYVGECYCGLQWNHLPDYPTIEEALLRALYETDMISLVNMSNTKVQQLLNFERASRTDKGVHALRNVISVALMLPYDTAYVEQTLAKQQQPHDEPAAVEVKKDEEEEEDAAVSFSCADAKRLLNLALPPGIHVYDVVPVTRSFNAYMHCEGRKYEYYLPTYALMPLQEYQSYFPASLAPAQPSLADVGFRPGKQGKHGRDGNGTQLPRRPLTEEEEEAQKRKSKRKSKGHFPKRKKARVAARAAAAAAAVAAAEGEEPSAPPPTTATEPAEGQTPPNNNGNPDDEDDADERASTDSEAEVEAALRAAEAATSPTFDTNYATHFHDGLFETMILFRAIPPEEMVKVAGYRLPPDQLERVRALFHSYEGTHCYHNFTPGGRSYDASCHRFIRRVKVTDPILISPADALLEECISNWSMRRFYAPDERLADTYAAWVQEEVAQHGDGGPEAIDAALRARMRAHLRAVYPDGIEVVRIELTGQSFMLNQIRKMIGAVVCIAAAGLSSTYIPDVLLKKGVRQGIPMAPANGLFLSSLDFTGYNRRLERIQVEGNNGADKQPLDVQEGVSAEEVEEQRRRIVAVILRNEMAEDGMGKWMRSLRHVVRLAWKHDIE